jgi:hypothetical protein
MEIPGNQIQLRGVIISKEILEERYNMKLNEMEWNIFKTSLQKSWKEDDEELRKLVFKHIKKSLEQQDFKLQIEGTQLVFKKKTTE